MKFTAIILLSACLAASANGHSQSITLKVNDAPLEKVFRQIEQQSGYSFVYTQTEIGAAKKVDLDVKGMTLEEVLKLCFKNQPLSYTIRNKFIVVKPDPNKNIIQDKIDELTPPPPIDVKGRIVNENGEPIAGASVQVKGDKNKGANTNENGYFELKGIDENATLVISAVNIETIELKLNGRTDLTLTAKTRISKLDEVQIIGYGTNTQRYNVGSVTKVTSEEISRQPVTNPLAALQGRVPGLTVSPSSGLPGASINIQIRGQNSLSPDPMLTLFPRDNPLFIIDGVPFAPQNSNLNQFSSMISPGNNSLANNYYGGISPFSSINPSDIESIEVLRDADATAIYGSRGANGVILITTKKGKAGKTNASLNISTGLSQVAKKPEMLNTQQYLEMRKEAFKNDNRIPSLVSTNANYAPDLLVFDSTKNTDWVDYFIGGSAQYMNVNSSISGGNDNTQFLIGVGYNVETYIFPGDFSNKTGSVNANVFHTSSNKKFSVSLSTNYSHNSNNSSSSPNLLTALTLPPNYPDLLDANGNLVWEYKGHQLNDIGAPSNPISYLFKKYRVTNKNLLSNLQLSYTLMKGLVLKSSFGYNNYNSDEYSSNPFRSNNPTRNISASASFGTRKFSSYIIEPQLDYNTKVGRTKLNIIAGSTFQHQTTATNQMTGSGYTNDELMGSINAAPNKSISDNFFEYKYAAAFGRISVIQNNKYILNLNGRRDGSSRFGRENQFGNFGSIGAGWLFAEENFVKKGLPWLSYGKLRFSYGSTGSDNAGDYQYIPRWQPNQYQYQGQIAYLPQNLANPNFQWGITRKLEVGFELGFAKDKVLFNGNWYRNRSGNQLVTYTLPSQTGFTGVVENLTALVQNSGLELQIVSNNIKSKVFNWTTSLNLTIPIDNQKLLAFPGIENTFYALKYIIGQPTNIITGYQFYGINDSAGIFQFLKADNTPTFNPVSLGNGKFNDYVVIANPNPDFFGGISNTFSYKGFDLDIFIEFKKQIGINYFGQIYPLRVPGLLGNQPVYVLDRWQQSGDRAAFQRFTTQASTPAGRAARTFFINSSGRWSDASYVRFKNVSISYNFSEKLLKKAKLKGLRLFLNAQNLFTITNYKGTDPETQSLYNLPPLRTIAGGLQVNL